jgi:hypothetical protein
VGEAKFGLIEGVISTLPGFLENKEVVQVEFDPGIISYKELVRKAMDLECAAPVFCRTEAQHKRAKRIAGERAVLSSEAVTPDQEPKYYLSRTNLKYLPMTPLQAARVNALIKDPGHRALLSPAQLSLLSVIEDRPDAGWDVAIGKELRPAWEKAQQVRSRIVKGKIQTPVKDD